MSEFVLLNAENNMIMGCYSTLDEAAMAYNNIFFKGKRIPMYNIIEFKINPRDAYLFGAVKNKWTILAEAR
jgi:hypothetical protein